MRTRKCARVCACAAVYGYQHPQQALNKAAMRMGWHWFTVARTTVKQPRHLKMCLTVQQPTVAHTLWHGMHTMLHTHCGMACIQCCTHTVAWHAYNVAHTLWHGMHTMLHTHTVAWHAYNVAHTLWHGMHTMLHTHCGMACIQCTT